MKKNPPALVVVKPRFKRAVTSYWMPCRVTTSVLGLQAPSKTEVSSGTSSRGVSFTAVNEVFFWIDRSLIESLQPVWH